MRILRKIIGCLLLLLGLFAGGVGSEASDVYDGITTALGWPDPPMKEGYHLYFDGLDDIATIGPFTSLIQNTVEVWIKPARMGEAVEGAVIVNGGGPRAYCGSGVSIFAAKRELCYETDPAGCGNDIDICIHYEVDAQWVHIAGTFDGNTSRIYINGKLIHELANVTFDSGEWLTLGGYQYFNGSQSLFEGEMDEVRIWNIVRSEKDIQATMFSPLTGREEGLVAYWNFDEGHGFRFQNLAGDRYHGILGKSIDGGSDAPKWIPARSTTGSVGFDGDSSVIGR
ncbi:MAG: LamG domain-containing protein [Candidatus Omnitrophica bacterium]|nr:LamG domain-containing protein [Candidatus Omnitrophota bacterium]